jgi:hypothetical protein
MAAVLASVVGVVECNPRGMKRIVNLLQIISVLGTILPHDDHWSSAAIAFSEKKKDWNFFLKKCVLWIVLCQNFPYRVSLLVQVLLDFDQKKSFNAKAKASSKGKFAYLNNSFEEPLLEETMTIHSFYMLHVDKFVKALDQSDKFCRVDKDPEEFANLLQRTAAVPPGENSIKCEDVLGPKRVATASTPTTTATVSASTQTTDTAISSLDDIRAQDEVAALKSSNISSNVSASESISDHANIDTDSFSDLVAAASTPITAATISASTQTIDTTTSSLDDIRAQDEVAAIKSSTSSSNVSASESIFDHANIGTGSFSDLVAAASTPTTAATISASTLAPNTTLSSFDKSNFLSGTRESGGAAVTSSTASSDASGTTSTSAFIPASGPSNSDYSSAPGAVQSTTAPTAVSTLEKKRKKLTGATHPPDSNSSADALSATSGSDKLAPSPGAFTASDANRDKTFSLLLYSFNLDPAIRNEVLFCECHNYDRLHIFMISFFATDWRADRFCGVGFRAAHEGRK